MKMNTDKIIGNMLGNAKRKNRTSSKNGNNSNIDKPLKEFTVSNKKVQVFNNNPIPKKTTIQKTYDRIPDNTNIPLQFMTREQYMKRYIRNQERKNNIDYPEHQERKFVENRTSHYNNIIGRYTTNDNPYYKPAVVVFNDKNNFNNIKGDNFESFAWHEYGHELAEKNGLKMKRAEEEQFADNISEYATSNKIYSDKKAMNYATKNIESDVDSKNMAQLHETWKHNDAIFYTNPARDPDTIFVNKKNINKLNEGKTEEDMEMIANMLTHEELHHEVYKIGGMRPSSELDSITPVAVTNNDGSIMNKDEVATISNNQKSRLRTVQNLNTKIKPGANTEEKWRSEMNNETSTNNAYDRFEERSSKYPKTDIYSDDLKLWKKKVMVEDYQPDGEYPEVTDEEFQDEQQERDYATSFENYGRRKQYSGKQIGNTMIAVDTMLPTAKAGTIAGLGVRKYVDTVNVEHTDEHDNAKRIPSVSVQLKNSKDKWAPKYTGEPYETY